MNRNLMNANSEMNPWSFLRDEVWDLFDRFSHGGDLPLMPLNQPFVPKIEMKDQDKAYQVCVEVPGVSEKDLNVTLKDNVLVIEGEKKKEMKDEDKKKGFYRSEFSYGRFYRAIPLTDEANPDEVTAHYKDGILIINVAKRPEKAKASKRIEIGREKSTKEVSDTKH